MHFILPHIIIIKYLINAVIEKINLKVNYKDVTSVQILHATCKTKHKIKGVSISGIKLYSITARQTNWKENNVILPSMFIQINDTDILPVLQHCPTFCLYNCLVLEFY